VKEDEVKQNIYTEFWLGDLQGRWNSGNTGKNNSKTDPEEVGCEGVYWIHLALGRELWSRPMWGRWWSFRFCEWWGQTDWL